MTCNYEISVPDRGISVNRTTLVRYGQGRISCSMKTLRVVRQTSAIALLTLLLCPHGGAQKSAPGQATPAVDLKRAQKAVERGEKAEAEGRMDEALAAYDEAARYAPNDPAAAGRGAALRSKMVRGHVEAAERLALESRLPEAVEELSKALAI